ncbi:MAG: nitrous oxide reductase accessory protein NosL [Deferrisomatales bacterium]|nr:nitrous oxide reductase accessory protein NosL [Deferrisomatales bacterium]
MRSDLKAVLLLTLALLAGTGLAHSQDEGCRYCGMFLSHSGSSWMELHGLGKDPVGVCSLHCAAIHMALHPKATPSRILVKDFLSGDLIDADRAHWVLGGDIPGVMTQRAKWAFQHPADARQFLKDHGGTLVSFEEALRAALQDMRTDTLLIQQRRRSAARGATPPDR